MNNNTITGGATLGERIALLATRQPASKELRKATNGAATSAPKRPVFVKPTLQRPTLSLVTPAEREASMRDFADFSAEIGPYMIELVGQRRALREAIGAMSERERMACQPQVEADMRAIDEAIANSLGQEHPGAHALAVISYADAVVRDASDHDPDWAETRDALEDLAKKGFLLGESVLANKSKSFAVMMGRKTYLLVETFGRSAEAREVYGRIGQLVERVKESAKADFEARRDEVMAVAGSNQLSVADLKAGKLGFRFLLIPLQEWKDKNGAAHRRSSGGLTVRVIVSEKGPSIVPVAAFGGIERDTARIKEAGVNVTPQSLEHGRVGEVKGLSQEQYNALVGLHRLVRLGIAEAEKQGVIADRKADRKADFRASCDAEREKLFMEVNLTPLELLVGEKPGKTLAEWAGKPFMQRVFNKETRQQKEIPIFFCFCLLERNECGQIRVADCPERLADFFAPHREFTDPGPDFSSLGKLGVILRRVRVSVLKGATLEERQAADAAKAAAEATRKAAEAEANQKLAEKLAGGEDISGAQIPEAPTPADKGDDRSERPTRSRKNRKK